MGFTCGEDERGDSGGEGSESQGLSVAVTFEEASFSSEKAGY